MKLDIGCGNSPESIDPDWVHNDIYPFPHVEYVCHAKDIPLPSKSCEYIYSRATLEHMSYPEALATLQKIHDLLTDDGYADINEIPDALTYVAYYLTIEDRNKPPIRPKPTFVCQLPQTINVKIPDIYEKFPPAVKWLMLGLYGCHRWDGDEHKSLWTREIIDLCFAPLFDYTVRETRPFGPDIPVVHYQIQVRKKKVCV